MLNWGTTSIYLTILIQYSCICVTFIYINTYVSFLVSREELIKTQAPSACAVNPIAQPSRLGRGIHFLPVETWGNHVKPCQFSRHMSPYSTHSCRWTNTPNRGTPGKGLCRLCLAANWTTRIHWVSQTPFASSTTSKVTPRDAGESGHTSRAKFWLENAGLLLLPTLYYYY